MTLREYHELKIALYRWRERLARAAYEGGNEDARFDEEAARDSVALHTELLRQCPP
ncbi:MAG TPA: hypothetical protein VLE97_01745 [Gaiellaceae bacterium]|nr:hypothetical protein [Gaiellaceae bacterium]